MSTNETTDKGTANIQESASQAIEDTRRPAEEILTEQSSVSESKPVLFVP